MCRATPALLIALAAQLSAMQVHADDAWWGRDKALHLGAGLVIGSGCYGALALADHDSAGTRTLICAGLGQLPGLGKEIYDSGRPGNAFSGKDLFWTALGVLTSTLAMYLIERLGASSAPEQATHQATAR